MLVPICRLLAGRRVILASGSIRRKQILENVVGLSLISQPFIEIIAVVFLIFRSSHLMLYPLGLRRTWTRQSSLSHGSMLWRIPDRRHWRWHKDSG